MTGFKKKIDYDLKFVCFIKLDWNGLLPSGPKRRNQQFKEICGVFKNYQYKY